MKTKEWTTKDGQKAESYHLEDGDVFEAQFDTVKEGEKKAHVREDGTPFISQKFFLGVKDGEGKELTLTLTEGQYKRTKSEEPLKGKMICGESYEWKNPDTGATQKNVGLRVKVV